MPKIISECCELVKLCHINCSGPVFLDTLYIYVQWRTNRKSYVLYRTAPFLMTLNTPTPGFKVTLFFDAEYLGNGTRRRQIFNGILIGTYIRPSQQSEPDLGMGHRGHGPGASTN